MANPKKTTGPSGDAVLFISRQNARTVVREEFKAVGVTSFHIPDSAQRCISYLGQHPEAYLVLDWESGADQVVKVLESLEAKGAMQMRPVLLIAMDLSPQVAGAAAEYHVSRIHTGELTRARFREHIEVLVAEKIANTPLRDGLQRVSQARMMDQLREAQSMLLDMKAKFPNNVRLIAETIEMHLALDEWDAAFAAAKNLSENEPGYARGLNLFGRCLMKQRRYGEACEVFKRANLLNPFNVNRLVALGNALLEIDKVTEARENFEAALKMQRGFKEAVVGLGECMLMEGDVNDALRLLKDVSGHRELASIFNSAAILSMRQGRFEVGKTLYFVAMRSVGGDQYLMARLMFNLGIGYYRWQRSHDALDCFENAYKYDSTFHDARTNAGVLARRLGTQSLSGSETVAVESAESFKGDFNEDSFSEESIIEAATHSKSSVAKKIAG